MKKLLFNVLLLAVLVAILLGATFLSNKFTNTMSIDLTDEKIYSLSAGSQNIAKTLNEPITLNLYFSQTSSVGMTAIRDYKSRVASLLQEYVKLSKGKLQLRVIDTLPFSEAEDQAVSFGLIAATNGEDEDAIYFGLVGKSENDTVVIGFFDPAKEAFLEYDISSLLHKLNNPTPVRLTIVSDLQIAGGQNPLTGVKTPSFVLYQRLQEMFDVSLISSSDELLPANTQLLMLWHPQNINHSLLVSIDQFLMKQGKAMVLLDPHYESDPMAQMGSVGVNASSLPLLASYGINFDSENIVLDSITGLDVRNPDGGVSRHMGFLGLTLDQINTKDITSSDLDTINGASFGTLALGTNSLLTQTTLLSSSASNSLVSAQTYMATRNPAAFAQNFSKSDIPFTLAARFTGPAQSHFANELASVSDDDFVAQSNNLTMVVIADADIAADRFWVQLSSFFGETISTSFADNADFILNTLENLSGSSGLIGIRSRASVAKPFLKVQAIRVAAEEKFKQQEQRLQQDLEQTELKLEELQNANDSLALSNDEQRTIADFTKQRANIRKSLREVQFQLQRDISKLGDKVKVANIVVAPILLVLMLLLFAKLLSRRAPKNMTDNLTKDSA